MQIILKILTLSFCVISFLSTAHAQDTRKDSNDNETRARFYQPKIPSDFDKILQKSLDAFVTLVNGEHGIVPERVLKDSRCIVIVPGLTSAALVVGGARGDGLASCRIGKSQWSQPAAVNFSEGSLGLQAGVKTSDLILLFETPEAENTFKSDGISIGVNIGVAAGRLGKDLDKPGAGILAYARTKGAYAGVSLSAGRVVADERKTNRYYVKKVDYVALLEGREAPDTLGQTASFLAVLPN